MKYLKIQKFILSLLLMALPPLVKADSEPIAVLVGGLNLENAQLCNQKLVRECEFLLEKDLAKYGECLNKVLMEDSTCDQMQALYRQQRVLFVLDAKQYQHVDVVKVAVWAGDRTVEYLMITEAGQVLATSGDLDLTQAEGYSALSHQTSNMSLCHDVVSGFPVSESIVYNGERLIFQQSLRSCFACPTIGYAAVAYDFVENGWFYGSGVLEVKSFDKQSSRDQFHPGL